MGSYWEDFWRRHGAECAGKHPQFQVLRTWQGQPVAEAVFAEILETISGRLAIQPQQTVLDLCCGNGLVAQHCARQCARVTAVDFVPELLNEIDVARFPNIQVVASDALACPFEASLFDHIVLYAALQYFSQHDTITLFRHFHRWLKPGGKVFLGDVPDSDRMWNFFNLPEREAAHFRGIEQGEPLIGTWFSYPWLAKLANYCGFAQATRLNQPPHWPYAHFRFDVLLEKSRSVE